MPALRRLNAGNVAKGLLRAQFLERFLGAHVSGEIEKDQRIGRGFDQKELARAGRKRARVETDAVAEEVE